MNDRPPWPELTSSGSGHGRHRALNVHLEVAWQQPQAVLRPMADGFAVVGAASTTPRNSPIGSSDSSSVCSEILAFDSMQRDIGRTAIVFGLVAGIGNHPLSHLLQDGKKVQPFQRVILHQRMREELDCIVIAADEFRALP